MQEATQKGALRLRKTGIGTRQECVIFIRHDSPVCRSEGFQAQSRIRVRAGAREIVATLDPVTGDWLGAGEAGLSERAWELLRAAEGELVTLEHASPVNSFSHVRGKIYGNKLNRDQLVSIIADIVGGQYSDIEVAAFVTACADDRLALDEIISLTEAMISTGSRLQWNGGVIADKHCVGGLPGNRTTLILVPILAALGVTVPKTSSRAITSPAGTADAMETLAPVELDMAAMRRVVSKEGGCIVWGGSVSLSPADDIIIRVERVLDIDATGQMVASVLSKKAAAGSTHVLVDIPVGPSAKVRDRIAADMLGGLLRVVGVAVGLEVDVVLTDGLQPVGRGVGPALEARDALAVLRNAATAPQDLRDRSLLLAGRLLETAGRAPRGDGYAMAEQTLVSGAAWSKFHAICEAQGGFREPPRASHRFEVVAPIDGIVTAFENRVLAKTAKLAGAPNAAAAGVTVEVKVGTPVRAGEPLFVIHAESPGELAYAREYADAHPAVSIGAETPAGVA